MLYLRAMLLSDDVNPTPRMHRMSTMFELTSYESYIKKYSAFHVM